MTRRERVLKTLNRQWADRVPIDFGSTSVTGMHVSCVGALREYHELENRPVKVHEPYQMLGLLEGDLLDRIGVDTAGMMPASTLFGFSVGDWKEWRTPWGQDVLVPGDFNVTREGGDFYIYPEGDTAALPSGRMPEGGYFFDTIVRQPRLDDENLNPADNLEEFGLLSDEALAFMKNAVAEAARGGRAVVGGIGGTSFGDIALVPAPFLKNPKGIRDVEEWYISTVTRRDYIHEVFSAQCDIALDNLARAHDVIGENLDVLFVCGADFGTQTSSFCSTDTYEDLYAPYYRKINRWVHEHTEWKTFKHSCGAVAEFIPRFVESGFDILNPVQCSAAGMDPQKLKDRYGDCIVFWGGGVDTQKTLPFGTPDEVRREVLKRCEIFSKGGGFVFNAIHNVQAETPIANIVAMLDAVREFNGG